MIARRPALSEREHRKLPFSPRRLVPLLVIAVVSIAAVTLGWHRQVSFEVLVRHYDALREFIAAHEVSAVAAYIALYRGGRALSAGRILFTVIGGILFGAVIGVRRRWWERRSERFASSHRKSALGEHLVRRAGPLAEKLANGFRADAFNYLLFLRLVPIFPFWLVSWLRRCSASGSRPSPRLPSSGSFPPPSSLLSWARASTA